MLGFTSDLQWFAVRTMHCPLKWPQGPPLGAVAPPYGESHTGYGRSSVHKAEDGDAFECQLASDGWADCAPNSGHLGLR